MVEFVLVAVLLLAVFLAVVQLALVLHTRNTLVAAAADGARYAANADRVPADGADYARAVAEQALAGSVVEQASAGRESVGGVGTVFVELRATLPVVGLLDVAPTVTARGHAWDEEQ